MKILGIDTTSRKFSIALMRWNRDTNLCEIVSEWRNNNDEFPSERIFPKISECFKKAGWDLKELTGIAVCKGPGSFTGIRIGIALAKGLCAVLKVPLVGVTSLDAMVRDIPTGEFLICPLIDALRGEVYTSLYESSSKRISPYTIFKINSLKKILPDKKKILFVGEHSEKNKNSLRKMFKKRALFDSRENKRTLASNIGIIGIGVVKKKKIQEVKPLYLREPDALLRWKRIKKVYS